MSKNLYQRILAVMEYMGAVGKTGQTNYDGNYAYHKIDDIDDKLRQALIANGLIAVIVDIENFNLKFYEDESRKNKVTWYAECLISILIINVDNPEEKLTIKSWGQGIDYSDKATGKAISYASKAAYLSAFHLRGQPDNEADNIPRPAQREKPPSTTPDGEIVIERTLDEWILIINEAETAERLNEIGSKLAHVRNLTSQELPKLRSFYGERRKQLTANQEK